MPSAVIQPRNITGFVQVMENLESHSWKSWKSKVLYDRLIPADVKARTMYGGDEHKRHTFWWRPECVSVELF